MKIKKIIAGVTVVVILGAMGIAYAATSKTPAEIASELTGKTATEVTAERNLGKTYGTIAKDAGKLDEFQEQMLEQRKAVLDQQVKDGKLTQAQADAIYLRIKDNQATCDGTGNARIGRKGGAGLGCGSGQGCGMGGQRGRVGGGRGVNR